MRACATASPAAASRNTAGASSLRREQAVDPRTCQHDLLGVRRQNARPRHVQAGARPRPSRARMAAQARPRPVRRRRPSRRPDRRYPRIGSSYRWARCLRALMPCPQIRTTPQPFSAPARRAAKQSFRTTSSWARPWRAKLAPDQGERPMESRRRPGSRQQADFLSVAQAGRAACIGDKFGQPFTSGARADDLMRDGRPAHARQELAAFIGKSDVRLRVAAVDAQDDAS